MTPVISVERLTRDETKSATKQLDAAMLTKWDSSYLATCGYIRAHISVNLAWYFIFMVQGSQSGKHRTVILMPLGRKDA